MLVIRLSRVGKRNQAIYRIVVAEKEKSAKGKFVEELGTYNPRFEKENIKLKEERIKYWIDNGAQPSLTMSGILKKEGLLPEKLVKEYDGTIEHMKKYRKRNKKKEGGEDTGPKKEEKSAGEEKQEDTKDLKAADKTEAQKKDESAGDEKKATTKSPKDAETQKK